MTLSAQTPFVVFGDDWGRNVSTMQHVFRHIVGRYPVVWVNAVGHRLPQLTQDDFQRAWAKGKAMVVGRNREREQFGAFAGMSPASIVDPVVLPWHHVGVVHRLNTLSLLRRVRSELRKLRTPEPPVLVTGSPPTAGVVGRLGERASVYFCMDDFLHTPNTSQRMLAGLEQKLRDRVDILVATAETLTRSKRPRSGRAFHLPQGVNFEHFATARPEPVDMEALPHPRIGFAGGIFSRCDFGLLLRIADQYPKGSVVLVGPIHRDVSALNRPNVHVLGPRPYRDLPAYVQSFDVGIVPYEINDETKAVDPLKLLEYLAAGIPVVTTALPEVKKYSEVASVTDSTDGFLDALAKALCHMSDKSRARGRQVAREQTWERRADQLLEIIDSALTGGGR